jgi:hypothetical protein
MVVNCHRVVLGFDDRVPDTVAFLESIRVVVTDFKMLLAAQLGVGDSPRDR